MSQQLQTMFLLTNKTIISVPPKELKEHPLNISLFGELSKEDYQSLKKDIQERGIQDPLHITKDNIVISGHQRRKIAFELGIDCPCIVRKDLIENWQVEKQLIIDNLLRRHLDKPAQYKAIDYLSRANEKGRGAPIGNKHASKDYEKTEKPTVGSSVLNNVNSATAKELGISKNTVIRARQYVKIIEEKPELDGKKPSKVFSQYKKQKKKEELIEKYEEKTNEYKKSENNIQLYNGDFYEVCKQFEENSVDHIITDPPYPREFLPLWEKLSETSKRILKPGGFCIAYTGKLDLPKVIEGMGKHLDYYWQLAIILKDNWDRLHPVRMFAGYRPVLVYYKPPKQQQDKYVLDIIKGDGKEKELHEWQQAEGEIKEILERFTRPNDVILDPFMGSGTTIIGCIRNNRRSIGIELDVETFKIARGRIYNAK